MTLIIQHTLRIMLLMSVVLATTGTSASIAQQHLPSESRALLQHALSVLGLSEQDAIMPVDVYTRDVHRLAIHDSIFSDPIRRLDAVHDYADFSSREDPAGALHLGLRQLDLMPPRRVDVINPRPPYRELPELQQPLPQTMREIVNRVLQVLNATEVPIEARLISFSQNVVFQHSFGKSPKTERHPLPEVPPGKYLLLIEYRGTVILEKQVDL